MEIEYVGNEDNINPFSVAPIVEFAKYANESVFGNPFSSNPFSPGFQEIGGPEGVDVDVDTTELYLSDPSPRYGYEFDEEYLPFDSPELLPDFITVKEEYWVTTKQEDIWQHIKDGYDADGWNIEKYKLIPRRREYEDSVEVIIAEISPNVTFVDKDDVEQEVKEITIPVEYIIEDLYASKVTQDDVWGSNDSMADPGSWGSAPEFVSDPGSWGQDEEQSGGSKDKPKGKPKPKPKGKPKGKKGKPKPFQKQINFKPGKRPQVMLDSSVYNKAVIDELITNLGHVMVECFKIIYDVHILFLNILKLRLSKNIVK